MSETVSISGEITLLWRDVDPYHGDVILLTLEPDETLDHDTFELKGEVAGRYPGGTLDEGDRVVMVCEFDTIEVINQDTGETFDERVPVVREVRVMRP